MISLIIRRQFRRCFIIKYQIAIYQPQWLAQVTPETVSLDSLLCLLLTMSPLTRTGCELWEYRELNTKQLPERESGNEWQVSGAVYWKLLATRSPGPQARRKKEWQMGPFVLGHACRGKKNGTLLVIMVFLFVPIWGNHINQDRVICNNNTKRRHYLKIIWLTKSRLTKTI